MKRLTLSICLLLALTAHAAPKLKPNDSTFDNGPGLSQCAQNSIPVPAGVYYVSTTIETGNSAGGKLVGVGRTTKQLVEWLLWNQVHWSADGKQTAEFLQQPVTVIVWNGKPGGTLLHIQRAGFVVQDLTLKGAPWNKNWDPPGTGSLADIDQPVPQGDYNLPLSNVTFDRVTFLSSACAIHVLKCANTDGHGDHIAVRDAISEGCNTFYRCDENQSVHCLVDHLTVNLDFERLFDLRAGGRFRAADIDISGQCTGAILSLGDKQANTGPDVNANHYEIDGLLLDNSMRNVRIVEEQTANHPAIVKVRGFMASQVTPAVPLCIQRNKDSRISVAIDKLWSPTGENLVWPAAEVTGAK